MKENAAEACATQCKEEQAATVVATGSAGEQTSPVKEAYETCYTKCVAQETKEVAEEREKVPPFSCMLACAGSFISWTHACIHALALSVLHAESNSTAAQPTCMTTALESCHEAECSQARRWVRAGEAFCMGCMCHQKSKHGGHGGCSWYCCPDIETSRQ